MKIIKIYDWFNKLLYTFFAIVMTIVTINLIDGILENVVYIITFLVFLLFAVFMFYAFFEELNDKVNKIQIDSETIIIYYRAKWKNHKIVLQQKDVKQCELTINAINIRRSSLHCVLSFQFNNDEYIHISHYSYSWEFLKKIFKIQNYIPNFKYTVYANSSFIEEKINQMATNSHDYLKLIKSIFIKK